MSDDRENELGEIEESDTEEAKTTPSETPVAAAGGMVVPLHAATGHGIRRGRGRPKKINPKPTGDDLLYHAEVRKQKTAFVGTDPLVKSTLERQDSMEILQKVKEKIAKEAAGLAFNIIEEGKYGKDTSQMSSRHIAALREVAHIELEIRRLGVTMIDLKGERFQKIFSYLLEVIKEAAGEVLTSEQLDLLFNRLETKLDGWEEKAQHL